MTLLRVPQRRDIFDRRQDKLLLPVVELGERRGIHRDNGGMQKDGEEKKDESGGCSDETLLLMM
jgi:hypothetical protein